jgi:hypothetical protein
MGMDIDKILVDLRKQRDQVDAVMGALQTIYWQQTARRGRPTKRLTANRIAASKMNRQLSLALPKKSDHDFTVAATTMGFGE